MRFTVADEDRAVGVAKDTVRTGHFALNRITVRAVVWIAGSIVVGIESIVAFPAVGEAVVIRVGIQRVGGVG